MAHLITKKRNEVVTTPRGKTVADNAHDWDIQVYLHSPWLAKMATSPLYDDAKTNHGHCRCCSRVTPEGRKR